VRGGPEIPGVDKGVIHEELSKVGLSPLDKGVDNLQSCFGGYCVNGNLNTQPLLRKVEKIVEELELNNLDIKISASGCPNSCGISHLSDIGFMGVVEPALNKKKCTGCDICTKACRVDAIKIENKLAVIDLEKCKNCDMCIKACPFDAIYEKREGIAVLVGGRGAYFMSDNKTGDPRIGEKLIDFIDEKRALQVTESILKLVKEKKKTVAEIIDEMGFESFKEAVL
jgi:dissimilatory sulfite reductase (desulfoviridin) alpha/beta subunit